MVANMADSSEPSTSSQSETTETSCVSRFFENYIHFLKERIFAHFLGIFYLSLMFNLKNLSLLLKCSTMPMHIVNNRNLRMSSVIVS